MSGPVVPLWPTWMNEDRATERLFRDTEQDLMTYRLLCEAMASTGCMNSIAFEGERNIDVYHLDELVWIDRRAARLLALNGWWLDRGHWICAAHGPAGSQPSGAIRPE